MLAGTKKISAASENAAVRPRLSAGCLPLTDPQRKHSAAVPGFSASIRCSRPQVLQAMMDSTVRIPSDGQFNPPLVAVLCRCNATVMPDCARGIEDDPR